MPAASRQHITVLADERISLPLKANLLARRLLLQQKTINDKRKESAEVFDDECGTRGGQGDLRTKKRVAVLGLHPWASRSNKEYDFAAEAIPMLLWIVLFGGAGAILVICWRLNR
jgi:hypothetical protein